MRARAMSDEANDPLPLPAAILLALAEFEAHGLERVSLPRLGKPAEAVAAARDALERGPAGPAEARLVDALVAAGGDGEGALAGKFRHPSVAPYIRAMQRQVVQIEALLA